MAKQYDVSEEQYQRLLKNAARRAELRQEFQKITTDPTKFQGGHVFDAAVQRYTAMRVNSYEHFRPTSKTTRFGMFYVVIPIAFMCWSVKSQKDEQERSLRSGEVSYRDRGFKFS